MEKAGQEGLGSPSISRSIHFSWERFAKLHKMQRNKDCTWLGILEQSLTHISTHILDDLTVHASLLTFQLTSPPQQPRFHPHPHPSRFYRCSQVQSFSKQLTAKQRMLLQQKRCLFYTLPPSKDSRILGMHSIIAHGPLACSCKALIK